MAPEKKNLVALPANSGVYDPTNLQGYIIVSHNGRIGRWPLRQCGFTTFSSHQIQLVSTAALFIPCLVFSSRLKIGHPDSVTTRWQYQLDLLATLSILVDKVSHYTPHPPPTDSVPGS